MTCGAMVIYWPQSIFAISLLVGLFTGSLIYELVKNRRRPIPKTKKEEAEETQMIRQRKPDEDNAFMLFDLEEQPLPAKGEGSLMTKENIVDKLMGMVNDKAYENGYEIIEEIPNDLKI